MSQSKNTASAAGNGIGFTGLLTIVLIALKLMHHIEWPWIWVVSPLWLVPILLLTVGGSIFAFFLLLTFIIDSNSFKKKRVRK